MQSIPLRRRTLACALLIFGVSLCAMATNKHDQELIIEVGLTSCASSVVLASSDDNCDNAPAIADCGKNNKDCACSYGGKFVTWQSSNNARFELLFPGAKPFKEICDKSNNQGKLKCKMEGEPGEYIYDVLMEGCPGYDPKIILR